MGWAESEARGRLEELSKSNWKAASASENEKKPPSLLKVSVILTAKEKKCVMNFVINSRNC